MKGFIRLKSGKLVERDAFRTAVDRRTLLRLGAWAAMGAGLLPAAGRLGLFRPSAEAADSWRHAELSPEITPVGRFYTVSKNLWDPIIDARSWTLTITGLVDRPYVLDYDALRQSAPFVQAYATLICIDNEIGGRLVGNALWGGVRVRDLLERAGVHGGAVDLRMEAADGYTDSIPIEKAMHPDTLLAWEMNGSTLTPAHGFPARMVIPGIYGMKNVKWITRMEVVNYDYQGFWQRRGWSDTAVVKTMTRIDTPGRRVSAGGEALVGGIAFAGDRGINKVEYSADGGLTWIEAELKEPLGPNAWRLWRGFHRFERGLHTLTARAVDGTGELQDPNPASPWPEGAQGYHRFLLDAR